MKQNHRKAFTLIELLVVISIIALLIAILLPALSSAQRSVDRMICLSNQRSWGIAMLSYNTDNKDTYPVVNSAPHNPWYSLFGKQTALGTMPAEDRPLNDYVNDEEEAARCPDDRGQSSSFATWEDGSGLSVFDQLGFSYLFAQGGDVFGIRYLVGHGSAEPVRISDLNGPMDTKLVLSEYNHYPNRPWANPTNRWHDFKSTPDLTRQSVVAFADGHAEYLVFPEDWESRGLFPPVDPMSELW